MSTVAATRSKTYDIVYIAVFAVIMAICSWISIPMTVPFTLQTFGVFVTAGILGTKRGTLAVIVYILLGIIGVPVFCGAGGPGVIVGTTGGYITGFIFTALIIGIITHFFEKSSTWLNIGATVVAMILGDVVCFVIGTIQFMFVMKTSLTVALGYCVIPFIIPDLVKILVATIIVNRMKKYVKILN